VTLQRRGEGREREGRKKTSCLQIVRFKYWLRKRSDRRESKRRRGCSRVELVSRRKGRRGGGEKEKGNRAPIHNATRERGRSHGPTKRK
jgi:hypothetical protein